MEVERVMFAQVAEGLWGDDADSRACARKAARERFECVQNRGAHRQPIEAGHDRDAQGCERFCPGGWELEPPGDVLPHFGPGDYAHGELQVFG